jgi:hypothetical protein
VGHVHLIHDTKRLILLIAEPVQGLGPLLEVVPDPLLEASGAVLARFPNLLFDGRLEAGPQHGQA